MMDFFVNGRLYLSPPPERPPPQPHLWPAVELRFGGVPWIIPATALLRYRGRWRRGCKQPSRDSLFWCDSSFPFMFTPDCTSTLFMLLQAQAINDKRVTPTSPIFCTALVVASLQ
eukprot:TRINITY_DN16542_c0_g1_i1.p1 TRINITY_DN16542_c0_g1~~TRINITY_DN16542_c0_g1_i1.p1  ORF type:complete len:115 (-),score=13.01 TRINITY_DN16542_c0_g1_i1:174-518(-)